MSTSTPTVPDGILALDPSQIALYKRVPCPTCKSVKDLTPDNFYRAKKYGEGALYVNSCKACQKASRAKTAELQKAGERTFKPRPRVAS